MPETIHTFTGGMDLDTEKTLRSNNVTYVTQNIRLVTHEDGTTGAKKVIKGNSLHHNFSYVDKVYASCLIRNYLVIFGKYGSRSVITRLTLDDNDNVIQEKEIYSDNKNNNTGLLNFTDNTIKSIGRYESENIIKVYWVDGINPVRYINIAIDNTTNGLPYNGINNYYVSPDKLEFVPNVIFNSIQSLQVKRGGLLQSGIVRYVYQYYDKYGVESLFSQPTNPIHLVESSDSSTTSIKYEGSDVDVNTGKSVVLTLQHLNDNNSFNHLKVIRIHYSTFGGIPTINLIADIEIEKYFSEASKTYTIVDSGNSIGEYLPEEISVLGNLLFTATDIATKDDLLFLSNINEDVFDVDFDARTFRFPQSGNTCYLVNDGVENSYSLLSDSISDWNTFLNAVGATNDCINLFNDLTYDDKVVYSALKYNGKYQRNNTTVGGSGKNVQYSFVTKEIKLDESADNNKTTSNSFARDLTVNLDSDPNNYSFANYASPYISQNFRGYQRGEIYRFGIVFFDIKGRSSKVKWIGDIRFPKFSDSLSSPNDLAVFDSINNTIETDVLGIQFQIRNVPSEAVAWSIVRVDRKSIDKTVISQGYLSNVFFNGGSDYHFPYFPTLRSTSTGYGDGTLYDDVLSYSSPDINYGDLDYKSGDYFEHIGYYSDYGTFRAQDSQDAENVLKYLSFTDTSVFNKITPDKVIYNEPSVTTTTYAIGSIDVHPLVSIQDGIGSGVMGSSMIFTYTGTPTYAAGSTTTNIHNTGVVNLRRINNSQYGGNTYENRFNNIYIPCGNIITSDSSSFTTTNVFPTAVSVYGGDIFITMYEKLHGIYWPGPDDNKKCRVVYAPLESKYNLAINHGTTYSRNYSTDDDIELIREIAGEHSDTSSFIFSQAKDFYIYNTVYSSLDTPITYLSSSNLDNEVTEYGFRVVVSNKKINNEIIDSWSKFNVNDFIDVDSTHGNINNLVMLKGKLFFLQDKAFGILSVNERSVITDSSSPTGISLGTGGVLDRYDYLSTYYGNTNKYGTLSTESGIYWIDNNRNEIILYDGEGIKPLSKIKKVDSHMRSFYNKITNVITAYYPKYNEVLFKITTDSEQDTLVFSELMNCFDYFWTIPNTKFITLDRELLTVYNDGVDDILYKEGSGSYCNFYGVYYPSYIKIMHTDNYSYVKVYDNIEYASTTKDINGIDIFNSTFRYLQVYNDYQNTTSVTLIKGTNIERRERTWALAIPRNAVDVNISSNPNIFTDVNETQLYKERIRNNWAIFTFNYPNGNNYSFTVPYITIKYRISLR